MAIIYTYPEINQVEGEDLLLISDTSLYKRPTRSVTIDNLAAYIGTVVGVVQNLQSVLTVGNTYVSPDGYGTFTLNDITNNDGQIKYLNTDEGWGYFLNAEEGLFFTDGTGSQTGSTSIGLGYVSIGNSNHIGEIRSANITANRTYQLPNASGTIALENVSEWYNVTGSRGLGNLLVKIGDYDNSGSGFKLVVNTEDSVAEVSEGSKILRLTPSTLEWEDTYQSSLQLLSVTGNRIWSLPDASGTIALTSDIPTPGPSGSGTTNYTARWTSASTLGIGALYDNGTSVGIGINGTYASPPQRLTVVSDDSIQPVAQFKNIGTGGGLFVRTDGTTRPLFELFSGSSYRVVVTGSGNLGIGTTSPSQKLEVVGNIQATGARSISSSFDANHYMRIESSSSGGILKGTDGGVITTLVRTYGDSYFNGGNVGIGTTSPQEKLDISAGNIRLDDNQRISWSSSDSNIGRVRVTGNETGNFIAIATDNSDRVRINNTGVGIGTTSPSDKLEVYGGNLIVNDGTSKSRLRPSDLYMQQAGVIKAWLRADGNSYLNGGNLGIGTTSPAYILDVVSAGTATARLKSAGTGAISLRYENGSGFKSAAVVDNNGLYRLDATNISLNPTNNVGIGTTNPGTKLHVSGGIITVNDGTGITYYEGNKINSYNVSGYTIIGRDGLTLSTASADKDIVLSPTGNVGIGTTNPTKKLHVDGNTLISAERYYYVAGGGAGFGSDASGNFKIRQNGTDLIFGSGNNVGIGTTSPSTKLHVVGTGSFTGQVTIPATPVASTDAASKSYVDAHGGGLGPFLPIAGGTMSGHTNHSDNVKDKYGTGNDFQIWHDGSNTFLSNEGEGHLNIINTGDDRDIIFKTDDGSGATTEYFRIDGSSTINVFSKPTWHGDGVKSFYGNSQDLQIYHDGSNSFMVDAGAGDMLHYYSNDWKVIKYGTGELSIWATTDAGVKLYYDSVKKFETGSTGVTVAGNISFGDSHFIGDDADDNLLIQGSASENVIIRSEDGLYFRTGGNNTRLSINSSGNVGIGTTSPSEKLHIAGGGSGNIRLDSGGTYYGTNVQAISSAGLKIGNDDFSGYAYFHNDGNVGIGTTSPSRNLHLHADSGNAYLQLTQAATGTTSNDGFQISMGAAQVNFINRENGNMVFETNNTEKMRITNTGNVGIGTTGPEAKLTIKGDPNNTDQPVRITNSTVDAKTGLFINGTGNSPNQKYGMQFGGYNQYSIGGIFGSLDSVSGSTSGDITFDMCNGTSAGSLIERMRVTHEGNVGIGTTTPGYKLEVAGTARITSALTLGGNVNNRIEGTGSSLDFKSNGEYYFRKGANTHLTILSGGNVGIGTTSPSEKLHVVGYARTSIGLKAGNYTILNESGNETSLSNTAYYPMFFKTNNSTRMTISNAGNVGIGTTAPSTKLHVNGDIRIQGENELYFGGTGSVPHWEITASGSDLIVNDTGTNVGSVLFNNDEGVALPRLTTTEINAISSPAQGLMAYNTTLNTICFYNGSSWQKVSHTSM